MPGPTGASGYWGTNSYVSNIGGPADFPASFSGTIVPYRSDANGNNWAYASSNCGPIGFPGFTGRDVEQRAFSARS